MPRFDRSASWSSQRFFVLDHPCAFMRHSLCLGQEGERQEAAAASAATSAQQEEGR